MKKSLPIVSAVLILLSCWTTTFLQQLPLATIMLLSYFAFYQGNKNLKQWMIAVCVLMLLINIGLVSVLDILFWAYALIVSLQK